MKVVLTGCYQLPKNPQHTGTGSKCLYLIMSSNNQLQCRLTTPTRWCWWPGTGAGRPSPATARRPWCRPTPSQRRQWSPHTAGAPPVITTVREASIYTTSWLCLLSQEGIYYKWANVKMTLKFHFLWSTLF